MVILKNYSLKNYNTFGIDVAAENFVRFTSTEVLQEALLLQYRPVFLLGGGSNMLLTSDIKGLVLKNEIRGIEIIKKSNNRVTIRAGGGENWHELTRWAIEQNFGGIENLSLIPGTVGAAPIQNIGAYGVELEAVFDRLEAVRLSDGARFVFNKKECQFGYRNSIFKKSQKGKLAITHVYLNLTTNHHLLNTSYGAIQQKIQEANIAQPTIRDIADAVIAIRSEKLPDPKELGNSGSFFKNPEISIIQFTQLQNNFPDVPHYPLPNGNIKIPAGWLIEQCGWKGKRVGNTGAHARQALVLVNYGNASGAEILQLSEQIKQSVWEQFGVSIKREVNVF